MPPLTGDEIFRCSDQAVVEELDGELVVLDMRSACYFTLNRTGTIVWNELAGGRSVREAAEIIGRLYAVPEALVEADLEAFVGELVASELIRPGR